MKPTNELQLMSFDYEAHAISFLSDGYMNLTEMCATFNKRPLHFLELDVTRRFITALAADTGLPETRLVITRKGGNQRRFTDDVQNVIGGTQSDDVHDVITQGTWAHPQIAMECARWLSPDFAIKCNRIVIGVVSGQCVHPAMDYRDVCRKEATASAKYREWVDYRIRLAQATDVHGNVSILAYSLAAGLPTGRNPGLHVGRVTYRRTITLNLPIGTARQSRTGSGSNRSLVATYPPDCIHSAFVHLGYEHEQPSLEKIENLWRPMLPLHHRLNAAPLALA